MPSLSCIGVALACLGHTASWVTACVTSVSGRQGAEAPGPSGASVLQGLGKHCKS